MTLHLRWAAVTDKGHVRSNNQDAYYAGDRLLVVADGMGGMAAGDVASRIAVEAMVSLDVAIDNESQMDALHKALEVANGRIAETVAADTSMQMLVDQGLIRPEEAGSHPRRAVVTQALQGEPVSPSYVIVEPEAGDR